MCLIHEAIGRVVFDPLERFFPGQDVILLPNGGGNSKGSNYRPNSYFRSSSADGFTQEILELSENEVIPFSSSSPTYYVLTELLSVCYHAISQVPTSEWVKASSVGIWGDGVVSYLLSLCIKSEFPNLELIIIGKHSGKLMLFSHAVAGYGLGTTFPVPRNRLRFFKFGLPGQPLISRDRLALQFSRFFSLFPC